MKDILPKIFTTNANSDDPIILRRFILLNGFYIVGILIFFMFAFVNIFISMNHMIALVDLVALIIFLFTFYRFRKKGNLEQATYIGIILLSIVIFIFVALNKNESFGLIWTIFIPIFSFSMLGHKKGLFISFIYYFIIFNILTYGLFYWDVDSWDFTSFLRFIVASLSLLFVIYLTEYSLGKMKENLKTLSDTDPLTKLFNRRKVDEIMSIEFENHRRHNMNLSICIFDIDDFKNINDTYGHDIGDKVLKEISNILRKNSRKTDSVARWGGEEFMIIMPHTNKNSALETIRKIKDLIKNTNFSHNDKLTCSFGISTANEKNNTIKSIFISADNNLYQAKKEGKDRIIF